MNKNLIIVGAGPGLSLGIAKKFGSEGYTIGLISRNEKSLSAFQLELKELGIESHFETADAYKSKELENAINGLKTKMGKVDTLIYNAAALKMKHLMEETVDELVDDYKITVANAFQSVKVILKDLQENRGSILLTGAALGVNPTPLFGSLCLGKAALRNLAYQLHEALDGDGIFVGTVTIDGHIQDQSETHSPKILAEKFWKMHQDRNQIEIHY